MITSVHVQVYMYMITSVHEHISQVYMYMITSVHVQVYMYMITSVHEHTVQSRCNLTRTRVSLVRYSRAQNEHSRGKKQRSRVEFLARIARTNVRVNSHSYSRASSYTTFMRMRACDFHVYF